MSWVFFTVMAALLSSCIAILDKAIIGNEMKDPLVATVTTGFTSTVVFLMASLLVNGIESFSASWTVISLAMFAGILYVMIGFFYYYVLKEYEVSRLMPLLNLSAVVIAIMSFFILGEKFSPLAYVGIGLLVAGAMLISAKRTTKKFKIEISALAILAIIFLYGLRTMVSKVSLLLSDVWTVFLWFVIGTGIATSALFLIHHPKVIDRARKGVFHLVFVGILSSVARLLVIAALAIGPASLVSALGQLSHLFTFVTASVIAHFRPEFLQEITNKRIFWKKMIAVLLIVAGAIMIT